MVSGIILGGVLFHVDGENVGFGRISVKTHSDDNPRLPGRGLFFSEIRCPWNFGTCSGENTPNNKEKIYISRTAIDRVQQFMIPNETLETRSVWHFDLRPNQLIRNFDGKR